MRKILVTGGAGFIGSNFIRYMLSNHPDYHHKGNPGEIYNIGGGNEQTNIQITRMILSDLKRPEGLIHLVRDRPAHDRRYALDCRKIAALGFKPGHRFEDALSETIRWYKVNQAWWKKIRSGEFQGYYEQMYTKRDVPSSEFRV